jgi:hypothetical protein
VRTLRRRFESDCWPTLGGEFESQRGFVEWLRTYRVALVTIGVVIVAIVLIVVLMVLASRPMSVT